MDSERRHELKQNELDEALHQSLENIKPYLKWIIAGTVVLLLGLFSIAAMRGNAQGRTEASWSEYFAASELADLDGLRELAARYKGTEAAAWAMQSVGDIESATGARDLFINKADGRERLLQAQEAYTAALEGSKEPILLQRAHMGLAQVYESLGEFDNAKAEYDKVAKRWPGSALAEEGLNRKRILENPDTQNFSEWFAKWEPPKKDAMNQVLQGGPGITPPAPGDDLPDDPSNSLPDVGDIDQPAGFDMQAPESGSEEAADAEAP